MNRPPVINWFLAYTAVMALCALAAAGMGFVIERIPGEVETAEDEAGILILKVMGMVIGLPMMVVHLLPFFLKPKPWVFVYNLVLVCLGLGTCMIFASVPLLIFWFKPEVKDYYGGTGGGSIASPG